VSAEDGSFAIDEESEEIGLDVPPGKGVGPGDEDATPEEPDRPLERDTGGERTGIGTTGVGALVLEGVFDAVGVLGWLALG